MNILKLLEDFWYLFWHHKTDLYNHRYEYNFSYQQVWNVIVTFLIILILIYK